MSDLHPSQLPQPASLRAVGQAAQRAGEPLVVMTSLKGCPYCELVRGSYLGPMRRSQGVHAVQIDITDRQTTVQGFDGATTTGFDLARTWKARFTPTVLFFDAEGREIAERLVGVSSPDY